MFPALLAGAGGVVLAVAVAVRRDSTVASRLGIPQGPGLPGVHSRPSPPRSRLLLPNLAARRAARRRRREADAELPQLLDALAASSSAGLATPMALRRSVEVVVGPLAEEVRVALHAIDLGRRWRDELRALADRMELPDLGRAVAGLTRSESLGASLTATMNEVASRVRAARRDRASARARQAPVKMLFPLVFLVLPAFLLLTVVPVLLSTLRSIR